MTDKNKKVKALYNAVPRDFSKYFSKCIFKTSLFLFLFLLHTHLYLYVNTPHTKYLISDYKYLHCVQYLIVYLLKYLFTYY